MPQTSLAPVSYSHQSVEGKDFTVVSSRHVLTAALNAVNSLFGGLLVQWVDEAAAIFVMEKLKTRHVVTKKISEVIYNEPARLGDVLEFLFCVKHVGTTSLTVQCVVNAKKILAEEKDRIILNCDLVFVKIDSSGRPTPHFFVLPS